MRRILLLAIVLIAISIPGGVSAQPAITSEIAPLGKLRVGSKERCFVPLPQLIKELNGHLKGWANYFSYGYPRRRFRQINRYVRQRLTQHVRRRSQRPFRPAEGVSYYEHFKRMGLVYL